MSLFGENNTAWTVMHGNLFGLTTDTLSFDRDTIINENPWKIIYAPGKTIYLQEDITTGKWMYFTTIDTIQKVLMDLSLAVGDTFYVTGAWLPDPGFYEVDSVYIKDQRKHVQLNLPLYYAGDEKLVFIEGVGPNIGLSYKDDNSIELAPYLLCQWKDNIQNYSNNYFDGKCAIFSDTKVDEGNKLSGFANIYPNPTTGIVKIQNSDYSIKEILVHDTTGRQFFIKNKNDEMDLSDLPDGLYLIKIICINGITETHKVLKNSF